MIRSNLPGSVNVPQVQPSVQQAAAVASAATPWVDLIEQDQLAELCTGRVDDMDAEAVAALCLEHAAAHPAAVERLLYFNENVRQWALALLAPGGDPGVAQQQQQLALCYLQAGFPLPPSGLAATVEDLMQARKEESDRYWTLKEAKHSGQPAQGDIPAQFQGWHRPFYYASRHRENYNGVFSAADKPDAKFACKELAQAAMGSHSETKRFLDRMSRADFGALDHAALVEADIQGRLGAQAIHFSPLRFGLLLQRLNLELRPAERRMFSVTWLVNPKSGHAMNVVLAKMDNCWVKPGLYEPNVTANISHMMVPPEHLATLDFDQFDVLKIRALFGVPTLALEVENAKLAQSCAGLFLDDDRASLLGSISLALSLAHVSGLRSSMGRLGSKGEPIQESEIAQLTDELFHTVCDGRTGAVETFLDVLPNLGLEKNQLVSFIANDRYNGSCLHFALKLGHTRMVEILMDFLGRLALGPQQTARIAAAKNVEGIPGRYVAHANGHAETEQAYMARLKLLGLDAEEIGDIAGFV